MPIDLAYPSTDNLGRPKITEVVSKTMDTAEYEDNSDEIEYDQIPYVDPRSLRPDNVNEYVSQLKKDLQESYQILNRNKVSSMEKVKEKHDRKLKKISYDKGDLVLCSNPIIRKGQSQGISPKYYGPFRIIAKNKNESQT